MSARLIYGVDVMKGLESLPDESVDCVVTSPPYFGLRDYGVAGQLGSELRPEEYVERMTTIFREVRRVLRSTGTCWLNLGDSFASGKGSCHNPGGGKNSLGKRRKDSGAHPLKRSNITTLRLSGLKPKDLIGVPWRVAFSLQQDGWYLRSEVIWSKTNPMPESVQDRPSKSHETVFLLTKSNRYYYDVNAIREPFAPSSIRRSKQNIESQVGSARANGGTRPHKRMKMVGSVERGANAKTVWTIATTPYAGAHFAVFPREIPRRCILAGTPPGGMVLDPFSGSGTTGEVAVSLARNYIGIDLKLEYLELAKKRLGLFACAS